MNLVIVTIADINTDKERVELKAVEDDNTINYILVDAMPGEGVLTSNKSRNAFWFPNQAFKKGDLIRVFTKAGKTSSITIGNLKRYTFYWGLKESIWGEEHPNVKLLRVIEFASREAR